MAATAAGSGGLFRLLRAGGRFQSTDVTAAMTWGVAAGVGALWFVQPFDWLKKQLFEKPKPEE